MEAPNVAHRAKWLLFAYRMPREPSTPRITLWRKLRQFGATQIVDGLVALPANVQTKEQLDWLAQSVRESDGEAWVFESELRGAAQDRDLVDTAARAIGDEYRALGVAARRAQRESAVSRRRTVTRLRRELHRIEARDHFRAPERALAADAIERLAATLAPAAR
jgi:hypothetical protein